MKAFVVRVPTEPRGSKISLDVSAAGELPLRVYPEESPDIEVLDSAIPVDEVPGSTLAKANEQQATPVAVAVSLGKSLKEVLEITDGDLGEPVEVVHFKHFVRSLRYPVQLGSFVSGHYSEGGDSNPTAPTPWPLGVLVGLDVDVVEAEFSVHDVSGRPVAPPASHPTPRRTPYEKLPQGGALEHFSLCRMPHPL